MFKQVGVALCQKPSLKKVPEKSARKKVTHTQKTLIQYEKILSYMQLNRWYKAADFINILDVKERRIKNILRELVDDGKLIDNGVTKGKRYKKANK